MTRADFALDPRLEAASRLVADLPLSQLRLQDDARWPWLVLVPRVPDARELDDLSEADRAQLLTEIGVAMRAVRAVGEAAGRPVEKLNVGALGNVVAQLHVHVVGRRGDDPAWPGPVWGVGVAEPWDGGALAEAIACARGFCG